MLIPKCRMNYIGSKYKLLPFIYRVISQKVSDLSCTTFCDLFAGTGIVGRHFKPIVQNVIANDFEYYAYVINRNYISNNTPIEDYTSNLRMLNDEPKFGYDYDGLIYKNYCVDRQYFSKENGLKIDKARQTIENWKTYCNLTDDEYYFYLTSLLEAADRVANTASVYAAYLKHIKKTAQKTIELMPSDFTCNYGNNEVYNEDANELIKRISGDILYLDPPYNERQYGANYHLLNTIAQYENFTPKGKTGLPEYNRSKYCQKAQVVKEFDSLIKNAQFEWIFLSYNNEGLMTIDEIKTIMSKYGEYEVETKINSRYKADDRKYSADSTIEYIHILHKL